ncbi:MAG: hypothetical protein PWP31_1034 [Clostridia bacterium]|nr:hypothetical protein [Clostridia bacterium]
MDIMTLIDEIQDIIESAPHVPLSGKVFIDGDLLLDYLDRLRMSLPEAVNQAQLIQQEKESLLEEAHLKAQAVIEEAKKKAEVIVQENQLVIKAKSQASQIIKQAEEVAEEIRSGTLSYSDQMLRQIEETINQALIKVREGRQELQAYSSAAATSSISQQVPGEDIENIYD